MSPRTGMLVAIAFIGLSIQMGGNRAVASTASGKVLAIEACSACHQVVATQKRPPPVANGDEGVPTQAPTFVEIANRCLAADQLRAAIVSPHYPMREQMLSELDLSSLASYIRSLAATRTCPTP